jgi:hypothetical protein
MHKKNFDPETLKLKYMQKIKLINLISLLLGIFLFAACEYATVQPDAPPPPPPPGDSTSFSLKVQPIFNSGCIVCHGGSTAPDLRTGKSYQSLFDNNMVVKSSPESSILYTCMQPGGSMASYGNSSDNAIIYNWIKEGAKNN